MVTKRIATNRIASSEKDLMDRTSPHGRHGRGSTNGASSSAFASGSSQLYADPVDAFTNMGTVPIQLDDTTMNIQWDQIQEENDTVWDPAAFAKISVVTEGFREAEAQNVSFDVDFPASFELFEDSLQSMNDGGGECMRTPIPMTPDSNRSLAFESSKEAANVTRITCDETQSQTSDVLDDLLVDEHLDTLNVSKAGGHSSKGGEPHSNTVEEFAKCESHDDDDVISTADEDRKSVV